VKYAQKCPKVGREVYWVCQCACGNTVTVRGTALRSGTESCGCLRREVNIKNHKKHGYNCRGKVTPEYRAYTSAKWRCQCKTGDFYMCYGGRGIKFLFTSFQQFIDEVGNRPSSTHSLDRENNDGHYEPGNVRWATRSEQQKNKRHRLQDLLKYVAYLERKLEKCKIPFRPNLSAVPRLNT
jgi:hypothetical protein